MAATTPTGTVMLLCPNLKCRKVLRVPAECRGKHVRCHFCSMTFRVPDAPSDKPGSPPATQQKNKA
ncbi:MAG: hypothetical protein ACE5EX_04195 [Phycisphaerae bacterium]